MTDPWSSARIRWLDDIGGADWVAGSLSGEPGTIGSLVPPLFDCYVRVAMRGETAAGTNPYPCLRDLVVSTLREHGPSHGADVDHCMFGVADVYGWNGEPGESKVGPYERPISNSTDLDQLHQLLDGRMSGPPADRPSPRYPHDTLETEIRRYMVYAGPIERAAAVESAGAPTALPDLWWPNERSWFVATDTDLDFLVMAGPRALTAQVAAESEAHRLQWRLGCPAFGSWRAV